MGIYSHPGCLVNLEVDIGYHEKWENAYLIVKNAGLVIPTINSNTYIFFFVLNLCTVIQIFSQLKEITDQAYFDLSNFKCSLLIGTQGYCKVKMSFSVMKQIKIKEGVKQKLQPTRYVKQQ